MNEHRITTHHARRHRLAVLLATTGLFGGIALNGFATVPANEDFDPNPPNSHTDIPEIGFTPGGPRFDDPRNGRHIQWDPLRDEDSDDGKNDLTGALSLSPSNLLIGGDLWGDDDLFVAIDHITVEDILGAPSIDVGIESSGSIRVTTSDSDFVIRSLASSRNAGPIPTPGAGILLVGGLALLGVRRRRA